MKAEEREDGGGKRGEVEEGERRGEEVNTGGFKSGGGGIA